MKQILLSLFTALLLFINTTAQQPDKGNSELTIPWDEFKKLINLDNDEIVLSLETFQKLLVQTGVTTIPKHSLRGGNVVLSRNEFTSLVNKMKPPDGTITNLPFDYLITKAVYSGKMQQNNTLFTGTFKVHVLKKNTYLKVPVLYQNIAISDIKLDGKPALVVAENGYHNVVISKEGEYTITANYSLKSSLDKGPHRIDFSIRQTPITLLQLEIPRKDIEVEIPQAQQVQTSSAGSKTSVSAVIPQTTSISISWRKKVTIADKIPAKLYSEVYHLVSIDDDALKINSDINYNILHSEVDAVQIAIPDNMNVLSVTGEGIGEWHEISQDDQRIIMIPFTYGKKGKVIIRVTSETPLTENGLANLFSGFEVAGTVRETGFIGVELNTSAEVIIPESSGLEKISIQKLPQALINKSVKPLIMGFKYVKHPYSMVLDIKKHEKIGVPIATINSASVVTLFTEDGKVIHRIEYQVRNSSKQFLEISLPNLADVWSVFVNKQPVESSINSEGNLLVPLIRSQSVNNKLGTFPVEIIYNMADAGFSFFGNQESNLPAVDLMISQLVWSVYLPNDFSYKYFSSTLEKEEIIRGINIFASGGREYDESAMEMIDIGSITGEPSVAGRDELKKVYKGKDYRSSFRNNALKEEQMQKQVASELEFSRRLDDIAEMDAGSGVYGGHTTGVLPIQIEVPTSGQVYSFAKSIIKPEDELSFSVIYTQMWINDLIKWFIIIFLIVIFYFNRRRFITPINWTKEKIKSFNSFYKNNEGTISKIANSYITTIVLFILFILFIAISFFLAVIFFSLFLVSVINLIVNFVKGRKKEPLIMEDDIDVDIDEIENDEPKEK
jgi:NADH:ubiquinone oxidoreductase subunit 3 (subunit A)